MERTWVWRLLLAGLLAGGFGACGSDDGGSDPLPDVVEDTGTDTSEDTTPQPDVDEPQPDVDPPDTGEDTDEPQPDVDPPDPALVDCDPLDPHYCSWPWPSNLYLEPDPDRATGYTLSFGDTSLPRSGRGRHIEPGPWRRLDGYGLGVYALSYWPNLDDEGFPSEYDLGASMEEESPILWFRVSPEGLERVPFFAELDHRAATPEQAALIVRPGVILEEGTRYIIAMRGLRSRSGQLLPSSEAFASLRDGTAGADDRLAPRVDRFEEVFDLLEDAGVARASLQLAWDFVTASSDGLHGNLLAMREDAFARTNGEGADLEIREIEEFPTGDIAVELRGVFRVPHYMQEQRGGASRGWVFHWGEDGRPSVNPANPVFEGEIWIRIPRVALNSEEPSALVLYGHGLNGTGSQVRGGFNNRIANQHNMIFYAINMAGMSSDDVPGILFLVNNFTYFPWLADRMHQGILNHLLVARAMRDRFPSMEEAIDLGLNIDTDQSYYSGISQGGIYGQTVVALSPEITRGHCGVPGNNYSTLLERSVDFDPFAAFMANAYPTREDQLTALGTVQLLWDAVDPISYVRRLHQPFPGQEPSRVILAPAKGDWQVAVFTNEIAARSDIGVALMEHYDREYTPWGIEQTPYGEDGHDGSGVVNWDFSNPWPPIGNITPFDCYGDPHGLGRGRDEDHNVQLNHFFRTGRIIDVCGGGPCYFPRQPRDNCP